MRIREDVELRIGCAEDKLGIGWKGPWRSLFRVKGTDGQEYFEQQYHFGFSLDDADRKRWNIPDHWIGKDPEYEGFPTQAFEDYFLAVVMDDVAGLATDAIGACTVCQTLFVRRRRTERKFCTPHCAAVAAKTGRKLKRSPISRPKSNRATRVKTRRGEP